MKVVGIEPKRYTSKKTQQEVMGFRMWMSLKLFGSYPVKLCSMPWSIFRSGSQARLARLWRFCLKRWAGLEFLSLQYHHKNDYLTASAR